MVLERCFLIRLGWVPLFPKGVRPFNLPIHVIHGNNVGDAFMMGRIASRPSNQMHYYGQDAGIELAGRRIFLVHYPHYAAAMAATGDWDLVCCGHTHRAWVEQHPNLAGGKTTVVNPGTVGGVGARPSYVIGDLDTMHFQIRELVQSETA